MTAVLGELRRQFALAEIEAVRRAPPRERAALVAMLRRRRKQALAAARETLRREMQGKKQCFRRRARQDRCGA